MVGNNGFAISHLVFDIALKGQTANILLDKKPAQRKKCSY